MIVCLPSVHEAPSLVPRLTRRYCVTYSFIPEAGESEWPPSIASVVPTATVHHGGRVSFSFPEPETSMRLKRALRFPGHIA